MLHFPPASESQRRSPGPWATGGGFCSVGGQLCETEATLSRTPASGLLVALARDGAAGAGLWLVPLLCLSSVHLLGRHRSSLSLLMKQGGSVRPSGVVSNV